MFSISLALHDSTIPALIGSRESNKKSILKEYSNFAGMNSFFIDSEFFRTEEAIDRIFYAVLRSETLLVVNNADLIVQKYIDIIIDRLQCIRHAINDNLEINLAGKIISSERTSNFRGCFLLNNSGPSFSPDPQPVWTHEVRNLFRPLNVRKVPFQIIFSALLLANGFPMHVDTATRLNAVMTYLLSKFEFLREDFVVKHLIEVIRQVGLEPAVLLDYDRSCYEVISILLSRLLSEREHDVKSTTIRCSGLLRLVAPDDGGGDPVDSIDKSSSAILLSVLTDNNSVIVCGSCFSGKSTLIKNVSKHLMTRRLLGDHHQSYHLLSLSEVLPYSTLAHTEKNTVMKALEAHIENLLDTLPESENSQHLVHVDSGFLPFVSMLTRWCALMFNSKRPDVKFLWEIDDISNFEPNVITDVPIVSLEVPSPSVIEIIDHQLTSTTQWLSRSLSLTDVELLGVMSLATNQLLVPVLQKTSNQSMLHITSLSAKTLRVACGLVSSFKLSRAYSSLVFESDFRKCLIFGIIWVIGSTEFPSRSLLVAIFSELILEDPDLESFFPQLDNIFESLLGNASEDEDEEMRVIWRKASPYVNLRHLHCYSDFPLMSSNVLVPTALSFVANSLQSALLLDGQILLYGDRWSGKSAVAQQLIGASIHEDRFLAYLKDSHSELLRSKIFDAQGSVKVKLKESATSYLHGSLFIEDVQLDRFDATRCVYNCTGFLHFLFGNRSIYNLSNQRLEACDQMLTVMTSRQPPANLCARIMRFPICLPLTVDTKLVMTQRLQNSISSIEDTTAWDITNFLHDLLDAYAQQFDIATQRIKTLALTDRFVKQMENLVSYFDDPSTLDLLPIMLKVIIDFSLPVASKKIGEAALNITRTKSTLFNDSYFVETTQRFIHRPDLGIAAPNSTALPMILTPVQFQEHCSSSLILRHGIPPYIDRGNPLFWSDLQRLIAVLSSRCDVVALFGGSNSLAHDMISVASRLCNFHCNFLVLIDEANGLEQAEELVVTSFQEFIYSSTKSQLYHTVCHFHLTFSPSLVGWSRLLSIVTIQDESLIIRYKLREKEVVGFVSNVDAFTRSSRFIFTFGSNVDLSAAYERMLEVPLQISIACHHLSEDTSYELDLTSIQNSFGSIKISSVQQLFGTILIEIQESYDKRSYLFEELFSLHYRKESFRLMFQFYRHCCDLGIKLRKCISEEYSKLFISQEQHFNYSDQALEELAISDSIQLTIYLRYLQHMSDQLAEQMMINVRSSLREMRLHYMKSFDPLCILRGVFSANQRFSGGILHAKVMGAFLPTKSSLRKLIAALMFALTTDMCISLSDHSGLSTLLLCDILGLQVRSEVDIQSKEELVIIGAAEELTLISPRLYCPTITMHSIVTSEVLGIYMLIKRIEDTPAIVDCWKNCVEHDTYSSTDFNFLWSRFIRTLDRGSLMLCTILSSAAEVNAVVTHDVKEVMLALFKSPTAMPMKSLYVYLAISDSLSYLKSNFRNDEYILFAVYVSLKLCSDTITDMMDYIHSFLLHMRTVNGKVGYVNNSSSGVYHLSEESRILLDYVEEGMPGRRRSISQVVESETEEALEFLENAAEVCADIPFGFNDRAFTWQEIFSVCYVVKPHIMHSVISEIVDDKGIALSSLNVFQSFTDKVVSLFTSLLDKFRNFPIAADVLFHKTIKCVRFHFILFHAIICVYLNSPCAVSSIFDETLESLFDLIDSCCSHMRGLQLIYFLKQFAIDTMYRLSVSNPLQEEFMSACFETMLGTLRFNLSTGEVLRGVFGEVDTAVSLKKTDTYLLKMFNRAIQEANFLPQVIGITVYDLNTLVRREFDRALSLMKIYPSEVSLDDPKSEKLRIKIDQLQLRIKIDQLLADIPSSFFMRKLSENLSSKDSEDTNVAQSTIEVQEQASPLLIHVEYEAEAFNAMRRRVVQYIESLTRQLDKNDLSTSRSDWLTMNEDKLPDRMPLFTNIPICFRARLTIAEFLNEGRKKFGLINKWRNEGIPGVLNLKFLQSPLLVVLALQENYAMRNEIPLENTSVVYSILAKMTPTIMRSIREDKEVNSLYFYGLHVIHAQFDESKNCLVSLPKYMNSIVSLQVSNELFVVVLILIPSLETISESHSCRDRYEKFSFEEMHAAVPSLYRRPNPNGFFYTNAILYSPTGARGGSSL